MTNKFDIIQHIARQIEWSAKTFGPDPRTKGVLDHIRKELTEIEAKPDDLSEWVDVIILAIDGAWRMLKSVYPAYTSEMLANLIINQLINKQTTNERRNWPDWRTMPADKAIEHVRDPGDFRAGDIVRYGMSGGSTALMCLVSPHAGGWHGEQFFGGITYSSVLQRPSPDDVERWHARIQTPGGTWLDGTAIEKKGEF